MAEDAYATYAITLEMLHVVGILMPESHDRNITTYVDEKTYACQEMRKSKLKMSTSHHVDARC